MADLQDLAKEEEMAKVAKGELLALGSLFASPCLQRPLRSRLALLCQTCPAPGPFGCLLGRRPRELDDKLALAIGCPRRRSWPFRG